MHQSSFVYIMTNKPRGTLYIVITAELARRVSEHRLLQGRSFTARYNLDKLVWYEPHETIELAIQRETSLEDRADREGQPWIGTICSSLFSDRRAFIARGEPFSA